MPASEATVQSLPANVLLISTYELGRQPFGLASPAAWLRRCGGSVTCLDLSVEKLDEGAVRRSDLVAFYLPMHTATRIAIRVLEKVRLLNPSAHLCAYGLYAPVNAEFLRRKGVDTILGGEFEEGLLSLLRRLSGRVRTKPPRSPLLGTAAAQATSQGSRDPLRHPGPLQQLEPVISLAKQQFLIPDRSDLPPLLKYAHLRLPDGSSRTVGYTEATRGCKHLCRHCPIVPVYNGRFRVIQPEVVLEDIRRQVAMGAEHVSFGDPDFFNGPKHAIRLVRALYSEHPNLTYDVTVKVEHLLKHAECLPVLRDTGCALVTTAVESVDDRVLALLDKGHTREDFINLVELFRRVGLALQPTFVAFTPWTALEGYKDLLATLAKLELIEHVAPIQLAIRLLIPAGSRLREVQDIIGPFDDAALVYPWSHPDPRVDALHQAAESFVESTSKAGAGRSAIFCEIWERLHGAMNEPAPALPAVAPQRARCTIPYLTELWYC